MGNSIKGKLSIIVLALVLGCGSGTSRVSTVVQDTGSGAKTKHTASLDACSDDNECPLGEGCAVQTGVCVPLADSEIYDIQITPPATTDLLPMQFAGVHLSADRTKFTLVQPVLMSGTAARQTGNGISVVSGLLVAQANSSIPFITLHAETKVSMYRGTNGTTFSMKLLPGIQYRFAFIPDESDLPPYTFTDKLTGDKQVNILMVMDSYHRIQGTVTRRAGKKRIGIANAVVQSSWPGFVQGSHVTTDENGYFSLLVPPQVTRVKLEVSPSDTEYFRPLSMDVNTNSTKPLDISVRDFGLRHKMRIQVAGRSGTDVVAGALVTVASEYDNRVAFGTTDIHGMADLTVPEGDFVLHVDSPGTSPFASASFKLHVVSDSVQNFVALLDKRPCIHGTVYNDMVAGRLAAAQVTLIPGHKALNTQFSTTSDQDGRFVLCIDPGTYALLVVPPAGSGLARYSDTDLELTPPFKDIEVHPSPGVLIRGMVQDEDGNPIAKARVDCFFRSRLGTQILNVSLPYATSLAASVLTDEQGFFSVVVPHVNPKADNTFGLPATGLK